jgi:DNA-binding transcriptional ArsR family regulator
MSGESFEMSLLAVSEHLKVLERAGLIARGCEAQWRPSRLEAGPLREVFDWVEHYRQFWEESFNRIDDRSRAIIRKRTTASSGEARSSGRRRPLLSPVFA